MDFRNRKSYNEMENIFKEEEREKGFIIQGNHEVFNSIFKDLTEQDALEVLFLINDIAYSYEQMIEEKTLNKEQRELLIGHREDMGEYRKQRDRRLENLREMNINHPFEEKLNRLLDEYESTSRYGVEIIMEETGKDRFALPTKNKLIEQLSYWLTPSKTVTLEKPLTRNKILTLATTIHKLLSK